MEKKNFEDIKGISPFACPFSKNSRPQLKKPRLDLVKESLSYIKSLHPSFWEDPRFLGWQLLRLNTNYQKDMDTLWDVLGPWFENHLDPKGHTLTHFLYERIHYDFFPLPKQTLWQWRNRGFFLSGNFGNSFFLDANIFDLDKDSREIGKESENCWHGPILKVVVNRGKRSVTVEMGFSGERKRTVIFPERLDKIFPSPIPWIIRFPDHRFLDNIPPWPAQERKKRGRPIKDWGMNLLVYELSQADMRDMEIARFLLGVDKSTYQDKHPVLVRIDAIKQTVENAVLQVYPT